MSGQMVKDRPVLRQVAPMIARAQATEDAEALRGISRCWQNNGYHVYGAGPCLDSLGQAQAYRAEFDRRADLERARRDRGHRG
jgi:hypothetical protein